MRRYKIQYLTLQGRSLTFTVSEYKVEDGAFVVFTDEKTGEVKRFPSARCEITEVNDGRN